MVDGSEKNLDAGVPLLMDRRYNFDMSQGPIDIKWFKGSTTNISYNCLERNIEKGLGDKTALLWEGNSPEEHSEVTYSELKAMVRHTSPRCPSSLCALPIALLVTTALLSCLLLTRKISAMAACPQLPPHPHPIPGPVPRQPLRPRHMLPLILRSARLLTCSRPTGSRREMMSPSTCR